MDQTITAPESTGTSTSVQDAKYWIVRTLGGGETEVCTFPEGLTPVPDAVVVLPTRYGKDAGKVLGPIRAEACGGWGEPRIVSRLATDEDLRRIEENDRKARDARRVCRQKAADRGLDMSIVSAHYLLEEPKILFFFTAESRVDFRELVKDLVSVFRARIELRQIGVRDEARMVGGIGTCGRVLCCNGVSDRLQPVSIKMAKSQSLSLSSAKISGPCGRLLCCLAYEYEFYRDERKRLPSEGYRLMFDGTNFRITEINVISRHFRIDGEDGRVLDLPLCRLVLDAATDRWKIREDSD